VSKKHNQMVVAQGIFLAFLQVFSEYSVGELLFSVVEGIS
jgi:hypothetical protein